MTRPAEDRPSPQILAIFAALIEERSGLHYREPERDLFLDRLIERAREAGFESLLDYYYSLRYDDPEGVQLQLLIESIVVHETYFFRELHTLEVAIDRCVLPAIAAGRNARIWSSACATGEEPVSIAILLAQRGALHACEIIATDVSERALRVARTGRYRARSLRGEGQALAESWLRRDGDHILVPRRFIDAIDYQRLNLCDAAAVSSMGTFDLVVCRNVLIYFAEPTVAKVVDSLCQRVRPAGALVVGVSESLLRFSTRIRGEELDGAFLYRRNP